MKTPSQPRAIYYIVAIQIWEYFSFYGMRALLILYLTHQLGFDDSHAISLFSAYASLVYVTPILGGWLADRLLGNRTAVIAGALLMTLGHVVLGVESTSAWSLYVALAIIICGYGLFKSNISCLLGELYAHDDPRRDGGFSLLYAAGNVGSIAAPIACGLAAQWYGWHIGFALAGIGMFIGLMIFLSGSRHFRHTRGVDKPALRAVKSVGACSSSSSAPSPRCSAWSMPWESTTSRAFWPTTPSRTSASSCLVSAWASTAGPQVCPGLPPSGFWPVFTTW